jgi:hypothetical protein
MIDRIDIRPMTRSAFLVGGIPADYGVLDQLKAFVSA